MQHRAFDCVRSLTFDTGVAGFEYALGATCFLARFGEDVVAITASHCVRDVPYRDVRIPLLPEPDSLLLKPFGELRWRVEEKPFLDLLALSVSLERCDDQQRRSICELVADREARSAAATWEQLAFVGYPATVSKGEDYEKKVLTIDRVTCVGTYAGPADWQHCHWLRLPKNRSPKIEKLQGYSGSPVFAVQETPIGTECRFAGMIITASIEGIKGGRAQFIDGDFITRQVSQALRRRRCGARREVEGKLHF